MPLYNTFAQAGQGKVVERSIETRKYHVGEQGDSADYTEINESENRVWVGLTKDAAYSKVEENEQPLPEEDGGIGGNYSWSLSRQSNITNAYQLQRVWSKVTTTLDV